MCRWRDTYAASTTQTYVIELKRFLEYVDDLAGTRLRKCVPTTECPTPRTVTATNAHYAAIYQKAPLWLKAVLAMCRDTGMRRGEAAAIRPCDWQEDTNVVTISRKKGAQSKLPLTPALAQMFRAARMQSQVEPVIRSLGYQGSGDAGTNIWAAFDRAKAAAGLADLDLTIHDLRRTVAQAVYDNTHDVRIVQQILGHKRLTSTLHYLVRGNPEEIAAHLQAAQAPCLTDMKLATEVKQ